MKRERPASLVTKKSHKRWKTLIELSQMLIQTEKGCTAKRLVMSSRNAVSIRLGHWGSFAFEA